MSTLWILRGRRIGKQEEDEKRAVQTDMLSRTQFGWTERMKNGNELCIVFNPTTTTAAAQYVVSSGI